MNILPMFSGMPGGGLNPFVGPLASTGEAMSNMNQGGEFAQLALRKPDLTAEMMASAGLQPPAAPAPSVGALVDPKADALSKAMSALVAEPAQPAMRAPDVVAPTKGGTVDGASIQRMMALLSSPNALGNKIPSLGALISGR